MREKSTNICDIVVGYKFESFMFKCDLKIKKYECWFIFESSKLMKMVKVVKSQNLDFWLWSALYSMWLEFQKNESKFMLERSRLVKMDKIVKNQNVDFWLEKVKVWLWLKWSNDHIALGLKVREKIQHFVG